MKRREFLGRAGWGMAGAIAGLQLTAGRAGAADAAVSQKPNIVVLLSDDLPWTMVGFNGSTQGLTPNLDRRRWGSRPAAHA